MSGVFWLSRRLICELLAWWHTQLLQKWHISFTPAQKTPFHFRFQFPPCVNKKTWPILFCQRIASHWLFILRTDSRCFVMHASLHFYLRVWNAAKWIPSCFVSRRGLSPSLFFCLVPRERCIVFETGQHADAILSFTSRVCAFESH